MSEDFKENEIITIYLYILVVIRNIIQLIFLTRINSDGGKIILNSDEEKELMESNTSTTSIETVMTPCLSFNNVNDNNEISHNSSNDGSSHFSKPSSMNATTDGVDRKAWMWDRHRRALLDSFAGANVAVSCFSKVPLQNTHSGLGHDGPSSASAFFRSSPCRAVPRPAVTPSSSEWESLLDEARVQDKGGELN